LSLEKTLLIFGIFTMFLTAYGASAAGLDLQNSLNSIFAPVNPPNVLFQNPKGCSFFDVGCNAANVALATEQIGVALEYPGILIFTVIGRISAFISLLNTALFGSLAASATVPFLELFELIILLGAAVEVFRLARGNSSGSTL
jgi:hypothetical protein